MQSAEDARAFASLVCRDRAPAHARRATAAHVVLTGPPHPELARSSDARRGMRGTAYRIADRHLRPAAPPPSCDFPLAPWQPAPARSGHGRANWSPLAAPPGGGHQAGALVKDCEPDAAHVPAFQQSKARAPEWLVSMLVDHDVQDFSVAVLAHHSGDHYRLGNHVVVSAYV